MTTKSVSVEEAEGHLAELLELIDRGEEVIITKDDQPRAKLISAPSPLQKARQFGQHRSKAWMSDDFNAPLQDEFWLGSRRSA